MKLINYILQHIIWILISLLALLKGILFLFYTTIDFTYFKVWWESRPEWGESWFYKSKYTKKY